MQQIHSQILTCLLLNMTKSFLFSMDLRSQLFLLSLDIYVRHSKTLLSSSAMHWPYTFIKFCHALAVLLSSSSVMHRLLLFIPTRRSATHWLLGFFPPSNFSFQKLSKNLTRSPFPLVTAIEFNFCDIFLYLVLITCLVSPSFSFILVSATLVSATLVSTTLVWLYNRSRLEKQCFSNSQLTLLPQLNPVPFT